jgi:hypothetical protein
MENSSIEEVEYSEGLYWTSNGVAWRPLSPVLASSSAPRQASADHFNLPLRENLPAPKFYRNSEVLLYDPEQDAAVQFKEPNGLIIEGMFECMWTDQITASFSIQALLKCSRARHLSPLSLLQNIFFRKDYIPMVKRGTVISLRAVPNIADLLWFEKWSVEMR